MVCVKVELMNVITLKRTQDLVNGVSPSFCLAKWLQTTLYLQNGYNHSCHHPSPHKIPLEEVKQNYKALHNTSFKKEKMQEMLNGTRPAECEYCWKIEDLGKDHISDRIYKSGNPWAMRRLGDVMETQTADIEPSYLEVSFSNVCNLKCVYCSPEISSMWYKEIEHNGPYPTSSKFNNFEYLKSTDRLPYDPNGENPYVDAFWKWWPELYPSLHTLRLTGGEPLLSRDVWKLIDYIIENPTPELTFCINSNLCVQDELIDKLITKINALTGKVKEIQIFSSNEATNSCADYIRFGMDYARWESNMHKVATATSGNLILANMTTVNILSATSFTDLINTILDMREKYNKTVSHNKIQFMVNYLRYPPFLALPNLDQETKDQFASKINNLIEQRADSLLDIEVDQLKRLIDYMNTPADNVETNRKDFALFVDEIDRRRNLSFNDTFPELERYYKLCQPN